MRKFNVRAFYQWNYFTSEYILNYRPANIEFQTPYSIGNSYVITLGALDIPNQVFPTPQDGLDYYYAAEAAAMVLAINVYADPLDPYVLGDRIQWDGSVNQAIDTCQPLSENLNEFSDIPLSAAVKEMLMEEDLDGVANRLSGSLTDSLALGTAALHDEEFFVPAISGKGLSTEDYSTDEKSKLGALPTATALASSLAAKATPSDITTAINGLLNGAPAAFDTLKEIADQLSVEDSAILALTAVVGGKQDKEAGKGLSQENFTTTLLNKLNGIAAGATAFTAAAARAAFQMVSGATAKAGAFPTFKSAVVASATAVFHLTVDGLSTGSALYANGIDVNSLNFYVNDSANIYTFSYALSNGDKTITVTAKRLNLLALGLSDAANGTVVRMGVWGN